LNANVVVLMISWELLGPWIDSLVRQGSRTKSQGPRTKIVVREKGLSLNLATCVCGLSAEAVRFMNFSKGGTSSTVTSAVICLSWGKSAC